MTTEEKAALVEHAQQWIKEAEAARDDIPFGFDDDTEKELSLMKIALSALTAEPVGYTVATGAGNTLFRKYKPRKRVTNEEAIAVYTTPPVAAITTPEGWRLVPVDLTRDMQVAWDSAPNNNEDDSVNMSNAYRAMIAAAPTP